LCDSLDQALGEARTATEYVAAYGRAVASVVDTVVRPVAARRERGLSHALTYIDRHFVEPISLVQVARAAGMAPASLSRLLSKSEGITFEACLRARRILRARQLLSSTGLTVSRVAEMSGWRSVQHFCRAFKAATGKTPGRYRASRGRAK